jgi:hypothetical protein
MKECSNSFEWIISFVFSPLSKCILTVTLILSLIFSQFKRHWLKLKYGNLISFDFKHNWNKEFTHEGEKISASTMSFF